MWLARSDIKQFYEREGWDIANWEEIMADWWSHTPEAQSVNGDIVGVASWNYGFLPRGQREALDQLMREDGGRRIWYLAYQALGDTSGRGIDGYLTRRYARIFARDYGNQRLILFSGP